MTWLLGDPIRTRLRCQRRVRTMKQKWINWIVMVTLVAVLVPLSG